MRLEDAPMRPRRGEFSGATWRVETLRLSGAISPRQYCTLGAAVDIDCTCEREAR